MKNILVTGAGGGIGRALVEHLSNDPTQRYIFTHRSGGDELRTACSKVDLDPSKHCFQADLTDEKSISNLHQRILDNHGPLWGLVNLAGSSSNGMSWKLTKEEFERIVTNNLTSSFLVSKEFIPEMRSADRGRILNVSSVVGSTGAVGASHYAASKAAIVGLTKSMSLELASKNITVNVLGLGYFEHGMIDHLNEQLQNDVKAKTPLKRFGTAKEIAETIKFIMSDGSAFLTGQLINVNGGIYS